MKLLHASTMRLSLLAASIMAFWSVLFYYAMLAEVNDETDDTLENFAENIMMRSLAGESLPSKSVGSNNQYFMVPVSQEYASRHPHVFYEDRNVFIEDRNEYEPARVLTHIFQTETGDWYSLEVSTPTIEKHDLIEALLGWILVLYTVLLVCIVLTNYWGTRRSMQPLYKLLEWVNSYTPGRKNTALHNPTKIEEFQQLNEVISRALKRSEELHEQQKQFVGNASHEMQTPLAVCIGRLEMLMDDESLTEQQLMDVIKVHRTLKNLSKTNRSLLLLCKIESGHFEKKVAVDFCELLKSMMPDYEMVFAHKRITSALNCQAPFRLSMEESLATTLVGNLLKNAYVHNVEGGCVSVVTTESTLRIENTGADTALHPTDIFVRFYHTPDKKTSTGLGLPIVKAICQLYNLSVCYKFENGLHVFEVTKN